MTEEKVKKKRAMIVLFGVYTLLMVFAGKLGVLDSKYNWAFIIAALLGFFVAPPAIAAAINNLQKSTNGS